VAAWPRSRRRSPRSTRAHSVGGDTSLATCDSQTLVSKCAPLPGRTGRRNHETRRSLVLSSAAESVGSQPFPMCGRLGGASFSHFLAQTKCTSADDHRPLHFTQRRDWTRTHHCRHCAADHLRLPLRLTSRLHRKINQSIQPPLVLNQPKSPPNAKCCACNAVNSTVLNDWSRCSGSGQRSISFVLGRHHSTRFPAGSVTPPPHKFLYVRDGVFLYVRDGAVRWRISSMGTLCDLARVDCGLGWRISNVASLATSRDYERPTLIVICSATRKS
jgi:hypothetical protein